MLQRGEGLHDSSTLDVEYVVEEVDVLRLLLRLVRLRLLFLLLISVFLLRFLLFHIISFLGLNELKQLSAHTSFMVNLRIEYDQIRVVRSGSDLSMVTQKKE